mgnify:FL=1
MDTRIRALREDNDYTQQFVADKIGITQRKYSYIETGTQQLTAEILVALSHLYNVSVDYLLMQTDITTRYPAPRGTN